MPSTDSPPDAASTPIAQGLGFRLSRVGRTLGRQWTEELADLDVVPGEAAILRGVAEHPGCALRALARLLATDAMSVKRCVDGLEERGLVASGHRASDRRSRTLSVTADGLALVATLNGRIRERERRLEGLLRDEDRAVLDRVLTGLERALAIETTRPPKEDR